MAFDDPFNANTNEADGFPSENFGNFQEEDPAAEFLEREQRELGDVTGNLETNSTSLSNGSHSPYQALSQLDEQMNEPETTRKWREEFTSRISKKDAEEEAKRKEMREQAKKELDDFYKQRSEQLERSKEQNRVNNRTLEDDLAKTSKISNGKTNDWEKITNLCEFNPKTNRSQKDLTRYRSVLLQLKQQQQANTK